MSGKDEKPTASVFRSIVHEVVREELEPIEEKMATKDDLKEFATKADLEAFATKDDLKQFVTKGDLKGMATKDDVQRLDNKIWLTEQRFDQKLDEKFRKHTNKVLKGLSEVMGELQTFREEQTARQAHDERVDQRPDRLETHVGLPLMSLPANICQRCVIIPPNDRRRIRTTAG